MESKELLSRVRKRYLESPDFNGLHVHGEAADDVRSVAIELVEQGLLQVVSGHDYLNPHIRPWPSRRSMETQVEDLVDLDPDDYGLCLYPTPLGMKGVRLPRRFGERPFQQAMAKGRGHLELAFFRMDVLEQYRNDGRYRFDFGDSGASMSIGDDAFDDDGEPDHDKVHLNHIGFAYDLSAYDVEDENSTIVRYVAAFYVDLMKLSPEHQQRWKTYQVPDEGVQPHPMWWASQMGHWPDGIGPFGRLFAELESINELSRRALNQSLFAEIRRPDDMGWLLRPSQREWDEFVSKLDKVLSENLRHAFFDALGVDKVDERGNNMGTLGRLASFMKRHGIAEDVAREALKPLRAVRQARQKPAHTLRTNFNDKSFVHRQVSLLRDVNDSLVGIRAWLGTHPKNQGWKSQIRDLKDYRF